MKKICVTGGCKAAGATFVASSLAMVLAEVKDGVIFVESPKTSSFKEEASIIDQLSVRNKALTGRLNIQYNVVWMIGEQGDRDMPPGCSYVIYDSPSDYRNFDLIICVIDALPSKVTASQRSVNHLKSYFANRVFWVLNRGLPEEARRIENFLGISFDAYIPMESQEVFYNAERWGKPLIKSKLVSEYMKQNLEKIAIHITSLY